MNRKAVFTNSLAYWNQRIRVNLILLLFMCTYIYFRVHHRLTSVCWHCYYNTLKTLLTKLSQHKQPHTLN